MADSHKWKSKLVSSSVPMEFEIAKTLVALGFSVSSDYAYARDDSGVVKDFSVDLHATAYAPFGRSDRVEAQLNLLVECKQRRESVRWLFFPDPNIPDFSPVALGRTLSKTDEFSYAFFPSNATADFDDDAVHCYKAVEIDEADGRVYDAEIRHGLLQLQYGLPRLVSDTALFGLHCHPADNAPFMNCAILVTSAKLMVADPSLTRSKIEAANDIGEFSREIPYLVMYVDVGPDFQKHCSREFGVLGRVSEAVLSELDSYRSKRGEYDFKLPSRVARSLASGDPSELIPRFTQLVVCSEAGFPALVDAIKRSVGSACRKLRRSRKRSRYSVDR
ncbi:hypothetical protein ACFWZ3_16790 [Frateuria sp. GZRR35]|uniref:hypothetical protein n=1 Tax=Frateuria sp. GZRR35 TaxID=3351536 RepID=UPI003EDB9D8E